MPEPVAPRPSASFNWDDELASQPPKRVQVKRERFEVEPEQPEVPVAVNIKKEMFENFQNESASQDANNDEEDSYDDLTVDELVSLFQNFKDLDKDNQEQLIIYMKKLEDSNPQKVALIKMNIQKTWKIRN